METMRIQSGVAILLLMAAALAAQSLSAGKYTGDFRLTLAADAAGKLTPEVSFGLADQDVKCKVTSFTVEGARLHVVYTFDLQGNALESTIDGDLTGKKLAGKYRTKALADGSAVDEGSWEVTM